MTVYTRAPYIDEYAEDGELVVMLADGRVVAVSLVAARVLDLLRGSDGLEATQIARALERDPDVPAPPEGRMSVLGLLGSLEGVGLLGLLEPDHGLN